MRHVLLWSRVVHFWPFQRFPALPRSRAAGPAHSRLLQAVSAFQDIYSVSVPISSLTTVPKLSHQYIDPVTTLHSNREPFPPFLSQVLVFSELSAALRRVPGCVARVRAVSIFTGVSSGPVRPSLRSSKTRTRVQDRPRSPFLRLSVAY
jgi:hypothetical protein